LARFRRWDQVLAAIAYTETLSHDDQVAFVDQRIKDILGHAIDQVPFYGQFAALKKDFSTRTAFDLLKELPITSKEFINRDPEAFLSRTRKNFTVSRTSGTTGTPFSIFMDKDVFLLGDALWWRRTLWADYRPGDWIARLVGDPIVPLAENNPRNPWIISWPDHRIYLSTFHLSRETAQRMGRMLQRRLPAFIMGYPSSLEILCGYLKNTGFDMDWNLKHVLFSSEPMHPHREELIKDVFKVEIRGLYGSGEKLISAAQCNAGNYHLSLVDGFIEGQFGIMDEVEPAAVTTLVNRAMPLIRYQIGDLIQTKPGFVCACGRTLPVMDPVITKHEDLIITPSGRKISPSAVVWAFIHQDIQDIQNSQVVQEEADLVRVYLNTDEDTFQKYRAVLHESMGKVFFGEMRIEIVKTDHIEVTKAGKSRFILNRYRQEQGS